MLLYLGSRNMEFCVVAAFCVVVDALIALLLLAVLLATTLAIVAE